MSMFEPSEPLFPVQSSLFLISQFVVSSAMPTKVSVWDKVIADRIVSMHKCCSRQVWEDKIVSKPHLTKYFQQLTGKYDCLGSHL